VSKECAGGVFLVFGRERRKSATKTARAFGAMSVECKRGRKGGRKEGVEGGGCLSGKRMRR